MATQSQVGSAGETYSSIVSGAMYPMELRKKGVDEATRITYLTRDISKFTYLIHKNRPFTTKVKVNDRMYKTRELTELSRFYTVTGASTDTYHQEFSVSNAEASEIKVNTILFLKGVYAQVATTAMIAGQVTDDGTVTGGTNLGPHLNYSTGGYPTKVWFSRIKGTELAGLVMKDYEQVMVTEVGLKDSGGTGHTKIKVDRCFMGPEARDLGGKLISRALVYSTSGIAGTDNGGTGHTGEIVVDIRVGDILLRATPAYAEGTNAPTGVYKNPIEDENFTQEYKYALEKTKESDIVGKGGLWIKEDAFDISRWLVMRQMNRDREYSNLLGRKTRTTQDGKELYVMGGVREFISNIIKYKGTIMSWPSWLDLGKEIFGLGGSETRTNFGSITNDAEQRKMFWNEHLFYNERASKNFNMEVNTLFVSGGKMNFIASQVMEEAGFVNEIICLDLNKQDAFEPVTNEGFDYKVDDNGGKGIQEPGSQTFKEQVIGMFGLRRRYQPYHCLLDTSKVF